MISTVTYTGDGATRVFPVAFEIQGENYVVVFIDDVAVNDRTTYDIINNSIVFVEDSAPAVSSLIEIVVASSPTEIADLNAPPSTIQTIIDNLADINSVAASIDNVNINATNIVDINIVATQVIPNLAEILLADDNATTATTQAGIATTKAGEATTSATNALASEVQAGIYASQVDPSKIVAKDSPTGSAMMPAGTTAERTALPSNGNLRYNNDLSKFEGYQGGVWSTLGGLDINTLTAKATPIAADEMVLADSTSSFSLKKFTLSNLKTVLDLTWTANDTRAKTALNASGEAPIYACRAWVNFNGTETVAIRASGNVSSIVDNGVGNYTINFTTAMPDANYGACALIGGALTQSIVSGEISALRTTSGIRIHSLNQVGAFIDSAYITTAIFR